MKSGADAQSLLKKRLEQWFVDQSKNPFTRFYLYYKPSSTDEAGDIQINPNKPGSDFNLGMTVAISSGSTIDQNFNYIVNTGILGQMPILN